MGKNKGFTLVELLITIAILSIVLTTVTGVMVTGSKQFSKGSADADMQNEAQLAVNQIEDMIIDTNGGVTYDTGAKELVLLNATESSGISVRTKELVRYDATNQTLVYTKWNMVLDSSTNTYVEETPAVYENQLLAEGVSDFEVDLSDKIKEYDKNGVEMEVVKSVLVKIGYIGNGGQVSYATSPIITLRNHMMISGDANWVFSNTPTIDYTIDLAISSSGNPQRNWIVDGVTEVDRGGSYNIWAMVNQTDYNINDLVNWTIDATASTISPAGVLTVNDTEPNQYITIRAEHNTDSSKYAEATVKVIGNDKSLDSVTIQLTSAGDNSFNPHFKAYPSATNYTDAELDELVYTWSIDQPTWAAIDSNGSSTTSLTIVTSDETYNKILNIHVRAYSPSNNQWVEGDTSYMIPPAGSTGDSYLERGRENSQVRYSFSTNYGVISYSAVFCDAVGNELPELDYLLEYIVLQNVSWGGFGFDIKPGLPADRDYYVKVKIHNGANWTTDTYDYERILYIAGVQLFGRTTSTPWTGLGRYECLDYSMVGYYDVAWVKYGEEPYELSVESIQYEAPEGVEVKADLTASWMLGGTGNLVRSAVTFSAPGYEGDESLIKVKSIKVKVSMKEYPNVFTYSNIIFTE